MGDSSGFQAVVARQLQDAAALYRALSDEQVALVAKAGSLMIEAMRAGRKIIWFGNGGSATQSQHMAAEFVGRYLRERRSLPSISLTENMGSVTAIGNDYGYDRVFERQLEGLAQRGDVAVGLSTSGSSKNVVAALRRAKEIGVSRIGLTRAGATPMREVCDVCIEVPSTTTARIQEVHLTVGHILCGLVDEALSGASA